MEIAVAITNKLNSKIKPDNIAAAFWSGGPSMHWAKSRRKRHVRFRPKLLIIAEINRIVAALA